MAPIVETVCEDQNEGIMQPREDEHRQIQEALQWGNLELRKLKEERVRLKQKSMLMNAKIRKLETEIAQTCRIDRRTWQDMGSHTLTLEDCRWEFLALLLWLWPHLIIQSNQGSAPSKEEREVLSGMRVAKEGPQARMEGDLKPCIGGATTWLSIGSIFSTLQAVERECGTIKESVLALRDKEVVRKISMTHGSRPCTGGWVAMRVGWEVTIEVIVHDKISNLRQRGVGSEQLRHEVRTRFEANCR